MIALLFALKMEVVFFKPDEEKEEASSGWTATSLFQSGWKCGMQAALIHHPLVSVLVSVSVMVCASVQESRAAVATFASAATRHRRVQAEYDEYTGMLNG